MNKNYISELHISRNAEDNIYIFISVNERLMLKDRAELHSLFTDDELTDIFNKTVVKSILLQDSEKRTYSIDQVGSVQSVAVLDNQTFNTYLITLKNNIIEFPARLLFNYSYDFKYYSFLKDKLNNQSFRETIKSKNNVNFLFKDTANYEETIANYSYANSTRQTETIYTGYIDFRKYNSVRERVIPIDSNISSNQFLDSILFDSDGFLMFNKIIIDSSVKDVILDNKQDLIDYYTKLINTTNDYDYKRYLSTKSIGINVIKKDGFISPLISRVNTSNANVSSEDGLFKQEDISLKTDDSKDSQNLFLMMVLEDGIKEPVNGTEREEYNNFLNDSFEYPKYFFKNVLKYKIEYLSSVDQNPMHEVWEEITSEILSNIRQKQNIFCRVSLKDKKYFDKVAHEYFLLRA